MEQTLPVNDGSARRSPAARQLLTSVCRKTTGMPSRSVWIGFRPRTGGHGKVMSRNPPRTRNKKSTQKVGRVRPGRGGLHRDRGGCSEWDPARHLPTGVRPWLFDEMSHTHGIVNLVSSFGFCVRWRQQWLEQIEIQPVFDLMSGMGELWLGGRQTRLVEGRLFPLTCRRTLLKLRCRKNLLRELSARAT